MSKNNAQKRFKIAAISSNTNSFGLNRFVFVAQDGEAWAGHRAKQYAPVKQGQVIRLETPINHSLIKLGFEIPERLEPDCPPGAVEEIWGKR